MNLEELYGKVKDNMDKLDFEAIWHGFSPTKFALYNSCECFFNGEYIEKPFEFTANTAVVYKGEYVAIWNVMEEMNATVLTSKMVHEMFHAFQYTHRWKDFPNEIDALFNYTYSEDNLSIKLAENKLLLELYQAFDEQKLKLLLEYRKYRQSKFPYEFGYECDIEKVEGSANYVEWQALKQLDEKKADYLFSVMKAKLLECNFYFPIRISNYFSGALYYAVVVLASRENYADADAPVEGNKAECAINSAMSEAVREYLAETQNIISKTLESGKIVVDEPVQLLGLNVYNARRYNEYLTSTFFLAFNRNGKQEILNGDFVIKMLDDKTIEKVYAWENNEN